MVIVQILDNFAACGPQVTAGPGLWGTARPGTIAPPLDFALGPLLGIHQHVLVDGTQSVTEIAVMAHSPTGAGIVQVGIIPIVNLLPEEIVFLTRAETAILGILLIAMHFSHSPVIA
jgi:hypothetical protein